MTQQDSPTSVERMRFSVRRRRGRWQAWRTVAIRTGKTVRRATLLSIEPVPDLLATGALMHLRDESRSVRFRSPQSRLYTFCDYLVRETRPARRVQLGDLFSAEQWSRHLSREDDWSSIRRRRRGILRLLEGSRSQANSGEFQRGRHPAPIVADGNGRGTTNRGRIRGWSHPRPKRRAEQLLRLRLRASHGSFIAIGWRESKIERSSTSTSWDPFPSLSLSLCLSLSARSPPLSPSLAPVSSLARQRRSPFNSVLPSFVLFVPERFDLHRPESFMRARASPLEYIPVARLSQSGYSSPGHPREVCETSIYVDAIARRTERALFLPWAILRLVYPH